MTLLPLMREVGRRTRIITGSSALQVQDVALAAAPAFPCSLTPPRDQPSGDDESPRAAPTHTLRWVTGFRAPSGAALRAGERISVGEVTYELLTASRPVRAGRVIAGAEAPVQDVRVLWPLAADFTEQNGAVFVAGAIVAVWGGTDSNRPEGTYEDREGEAPIEHATVLGRDNVILRLVDGQKLRVTSAVVDVIGPRVRLTLRRAGG